MFAEHTDPNNRFPRLWVCEGWFRTLGLIFRWLSIMESSPAVRKGGVVDAVRSGSRFLARTAMGARGDRRLRLRHGAIVESSEVGGGSRSRGAVKLTSRAVEHDEGGHVID